MRHFCATLAIISFSSVASAQVMVNQIDTFSGGISNWVNPAGLATVQLGGPAGAADSFMRIATNGSTSGPGHLLVGFNQTQWVGDYVAQGIGAIEMDLKNINYPNAGSGMSVRIAFRVGVGGGSTPAYVSDPVTLLSDGNWHHAVFPLNASNFTAFNSPPSFTDVLTSNNMDFRILHNTIAQPIGGSTFPIAAQLGIDNIHAIPVPEPSTLVLGALGLTMGWIRRRASVSR